MVAKKKALKSYRRAASRKRSKSRARKHPVKRRRSHRRRHSRRGRGIIQHLKTRVVRMMLKPLDKILKKLAYKSFVANRG